MPTSQIEHDFLELLREFLPLLRESEPIDRDMHLPDYGLDSLRTVQLMLELEDTFGVSFPDEEITGATFATPAQLWEVVSKLRSDN